MSGYLKLLKRSAKRADVYTVYIAGEFNGGEYISGHYQTIKLPRIKSKRYPPKPPKPKPKPLTREQHIQAAKKELEEMLRNNNA